MSTLFFSYACLSSILLLNAVFFLPRTHIPYPLPRDWNRHYKPPPPQSSVTSQANEVKGETEKKNESAALDEKPEKDGIESKEEIHIHRKYGSTPKYPNPKCLSPKYPRPKYLKSQNTQN